MRDLVDREVFVSGFNECPPEYAGGIWILKEDHVEPIYEGLGIFGLCWLKDANILLGATRVPHTPLIALRKRSRALLGSTYIPVQVDYSNYIHGRANHGIWAWKDKLYVVAAQGDPDSGLCTNEEFANHHVGKVIISSIKVGSNCIMVSNSAVWNPFECDHHHHYNDILVDDRYIHLCSFSTCDSQKRMVRKGSISRFGHDLSLDRVLTDGLDAPHSMQIVQDRMYVCSSRASSIHSISLSDPSSPLKLEYKGINNFVRGLDVTEDHILIGLSRSAGRTNSAHLTESINGILKFSRKNGTTTRIEMPSGCDNCYSIFAA